MESELHSSQTDFAASIQVHERSGLSRKREPVRVGVPLPRGSVLEVEEVEFCDVDGQPTDHQFRVLARWPDRSVKWILIDALLDVEAHTSPLYRLRRRISDRAANAALALQVVDAQNEVRVDTGAVKVTVSRNGFVPLTAVHRAGHDVLEPDGMRTTLRLPDGSSALAWADRVEIEEHGQVRVGLLSEGGFVCEGRRIPLRWRCRLGLFAGSSTVRIELLVRNPQAAQHSGGLWDLGDAGSIRFVDLSMSLRAAAQRSSLNWYTEGAEHAGSGAFERFCIYQDSSGGDNWDSPNHIDASGHSTVTFEGYRVLGGSSGTLNPIGEGRRATPVLQLVTEDGWLAGATQDFWQNFPKALRAEGSTLEIGLFPNESSSGFELQGGEQKRHLAWLDFGASDQGMSLPCLLRPLEPAIDPLWVETSGAVSCCVAAEHDANQICRDYVHSIVDGPHSFFHKREVVDEYGWRNFGDLYADHEAVRHKGPKPLISHYNNQYDFIYGSLVQFLRTGDSRWHRLMRDAAQHVIDIDIYHTDADRAAYNGGLFWHTDHYLDAATCSHRTYSRHNASNGSYGGGPSNEHNYTSGLLHYYYLSGDTEAASSVIELADWVIAMDDGTRTLLGFVDTGPTGLASKTTSADYHGPGRGAGNSINALLDGYRLTGRRQYMAKTEELIQRCIHPADVIDALALDDPEHRWSYLVFLQVLGRFLDAKVELGERDYIAHYARASLLHYAQWMLRNEVPYKDVLHKVLIPTETWPAHDIRKCHVLHLAARYAAGATRASLTQRAAFHFERCLRDLLSFETAYLTRPQVILCVYGHVHAYFQRHGEVVAGDWRDGYDFGTPCVFQPQSSRVGPELRRKLRVMADELRRIGADKLSSLKRRVLPPR